LTFITFGMAAAAGMSLLGAMLLLSVHAHMPAVATMVELAGT
jgi:hypothetical protein